MRNTCRRVLLSNILIQSMPVSRVDPQKAEMSYGKLHVANNMSTQHLRALKQWGLWLVWDRWDLSSMRPNFQKDKLLILDSLLGSFEWISGFTSSNIAAEMSTAAEDSLSSGFHASESDARQADSRSVWSPTPSPAGWRTPSTSSCSTFDGSLCYCTQHVLKIASSLLCHSHNSMTWSAAAVHEDLVCSFYCAD